MNVLYLFVIPIGELATLGGKSVLDVVGDRLLGPRAGDIMAIVAILSLAAGINAWTFAGPRVYFAMARDKAFFKSAARVHPKYKTPAASIVAQAVLAIVLILTGSLDCDCQLRGLRDHALRGDGGRRRIRAARARPERAAAVQGAGLSRGRRRSS